MKTYVYKVIAAIALLILNFGIRRSKWSALQLGRFIPGKLLRYPLRRKISEPHSRYRFSENRKISCPRHEFEPRITQAVV
jgi:hypothetical protein